eukprot:1693023-Rhodomonas_salina.2
MKPIAASFGVLPPASFKVSKRLPLSVGATPCIRCRNHLSQHGATESIRIHSAESSNLVRTRAGKAG